MLLHKSSVHDSRVRREAATLAQAGSDVTVLELAPIPRAKERLDGFARLSVQPPAWVRRALPFASYRLAFLAAFVRAGIAQRPDVVHAHDAAMLAPGALIARWTKALLVYDSHELATGVPYRSGAWARLVRALETVLVPRCAAVITVSDGIAERLRDLYGLPATPVVLRNVCALEEADAAAGTTLRAQLGLPADRALVLHQGSVAVGRGADVLIRAMAGLPDADLVLLGAAGDPNAARLEELAASVGVAGRLHVLPPVALSELLACTREADVGVTLLQDNCENHRLALPNKLFEYIAAGVPVVASALPELRRVVDGWRIGWTVNPADPGDVRRGLSQALAARGDEELRDRVRAAGRELRWSVERERLEGLYRRLSEDGGQPPARRLPRLGRRRGPPAGLGSR